MSCVTTLYHFSSFLTFMNSKTCCQIFWCFKRSSVITSGIVIMTMLNFDWDIVMMTIMMLRFADLRTLLMLFLIEIESSVLTTVIDVIIRCVYIYLFFIHRMQPIRLWRLTLEIAHKTLNIRNLHADVLFDHFFSVRLFS